MDGGRGTHLLENGSAVRTAQEFLGHRSVGTFARTCVIARDASNEAGDMRLWILGTSGACSQRLTRLAAECGHNVRPSPAVFDPTAGVEVAEGDVLDSALGSQGPPPGGDGAPAVQCR